MRIKINIFANFCILYFLQVTISCIYAAFLLNTFIIGNLDQDSTFYLYDVYTYYTNSLSLNEIIRTYFATFYNGLHAAILGNLFSSSSIFITIIINGFLANIAIFLFAKNKLYKFRSHLIMWLFCQPFILLYSIGWTKEVLFFFFGSIFLLPQIRGYWKLFALIGIFIIRPQWIIVLVFYLAVKNVKPLKLFLVILIMSSFAPLIFQYFPSGFFSTNEAHLGDGGIESKIDIWRYENLFLAAIGFISVIIKGILSPFKDVLIQIINGSTNFISIVSLYVDLLFIYFFIKQLGRNFRILDKIKIFLLIATYFIACLPFVHIRYILPLYLIFVCYCYSCLASSPAINEIEKDSRLPYKSGVTKPNSESSLLN